MEVLRVAVDGDLPHPFSPDRAAAWVAGRGVAGTQPHAFGRYSGGALCDHALRHDRRGEK